MGFLSKDQINTDLFNEVKRLKAETKRLEAFIETLQTVHFTELHREKAEVSRLQKELHHLETAWRHCTAQEIYDALPKVIPHIINGEEWSI